MSDPRKRLYALGFSAVLLLLVAAVGRPSIALAAAESPTQKETNLEERRFDLKRRELDLEKEKLRLEQKRLEIEAERKKLFDESSAREVITIQLQGEVLFDFGKAQIRPGSEPTLEKIAAVIQQFPKGQVAIVGHTDSIGTHEANLELSKARAQAVRDWLVGKGGLDATRIAVEGYGEAQPIAPNQTPGGGDDPSGRQKNRRVEIRISEVEKRSAEMEAAMKDLGARETDESLSMNLDGDVLFDFGKATILPKAEKTLQKVAIVLEQFPSGSVRVEGHTDAKGPEDVNLALSEHRAGAVKQWLVDNASIAPGSITAAGLGKADPVAPNTKADGSDNPDGRRKNRRVQIVVTK